MPEVTISLGLPTAARRGALSTRPYLVSADGLREVAQDQDLEFIVHETVLLNLQSLHRSRQVRHINDVGVCSDMHLQMPAIWV